MNVANKLREIRNKFFKPIVSGLAEVGKDAHRIALIEKSQLVDRILADPRYADERRLERFGNKIFSQFEEDGIIREIFRRIGTTNKRFVEFGVGTGIENNTVALLLYGWTGLWIEGNPNSVREIKTRFADVLRSRLSVTHAFITAENINELIGAWGKGEIDLLSIDIDGNDYYVFEAIDIVRPRAVVIEYNAKFPPDLPVVQKYKADHIWRQNDYFGASLAALERVARKKGYALVGCNLAGANAFFVRQDLAEGKFQAPFTAENHYQPARYFLWQLYVAGNSYVPAWGEYVRVSDAAEIEEFAEGG
jgi:hypothetical protein